MGMCAVNDTVGWKDMNHILFLIYNQPDEATTLVECVHLQIVYTSTPTLPTSCSGVKERLSSRLASTTLLKSAWK